MIPFYFDSVPTQKRDLSNQFRLKVLWGWFDPICVGRIVTFMPGADSLYKYYFLSERNTIGQEETSFKKRYFPKFIKLP